MDHRPWLDDAGYSLALAATACSVVLMIIAGVL
jgi:hypothetical protein